MILGFSSHFSYPFDHVFPMMHPVDISIILLLFILMGLLGAYYARKSKTTEGYFLGERTTPTWVLGLSMVAAKISSVTFLALPAAAFILDWRLFVPNLTIIPVGMLAVWILVPFYRKAAHTTAFEYLHSRFGTGARLYCALIILMGTSLKLGSIIYLVAIPLSMFTGISPIWVMIVVGGFCTLYTVLGGIQAVIWTDAIQAIILYVGGLAALIVMIKGIPGGLPEIFNVAMADDKFSFGPMNWDFNDRTFWTMVVIGLFMWVGTYTSDQVLIQRYLAAKDLKQARMVGWSSAFLCLPTWAFFFFLGTSLYVYYKVTHDPVVATLPADNVLPHFILTRMPHGLSGLVIAGILSAAMGSISAALNAFGTVTTVDIIRPYLFKNRTDRFYTFAAKATTILSSVLMLAIGYAFTVTPKESFVDLSQQIMGLIGGVIPGFFLLGLFFWRVNRKVLWQSFTVAFLLNVYLAMVEWNLIPNFLNLKVHAYWVSTLVICVMIVLALVLAWIQRVEPDRRPGMTLVAGGRGMDENAGRDMC